MFGPVVISTRFSKNLSDIAYIFCYKRDANFKHTVIQAILIKVLINVILGI